VEYALDGVTRNDASLNQTGVVMDRRQLLKTSMGALAALSMPSLTGRLYAAEATGNKLLVVFLRGGYDAANLLIPTGSKFYYEVRPNIAVPLPGAEPNTAIALNADWGLHPALRESIYPLYAAGQAAFIPFAGTDDLSRSHFETQDSIELGQPLNQSRNYQSGFLNRLAATLNSRGAIAFTDQLPIVLQGSVQIPNTALRTVAKPAVDAKQSALIAAMYQATPLAKQVSEGFTIRDEVVRELTNEMDAASRSAISAKGFELEARRVAKLMKEKHNIGFVDIGGWDTHVGQGGAAGYLAGRFDELGRGLNAFSQEMGGEWRNTVVVVVSEFGRTFRENGNRGTDHGHGSVYWVLGGGIRGNQIAGEQIKIEQKTLFQNRDYPVLNEYRAVFGGLFARMYGLNAEQLDKIFAGQKPRDLALI
jgi:uncharacterized protein (DUF1501 family)